MSAPMNPYLAGRPSTKQWLWRGRAATLCAALLLLLLPAAQAHDTVSAGNAAIEFHTDANELLRVDADTIISVVLSVKDKKLLAKECRCTLLLYPGQPSPRVKPTVIPLEPDPEDEHALVGVATVLKAGTYSLVLDGKPAQTGSFDAFRVTYELQAALDVLNVPASEQKP